MTHLRLDSWEFSDVVVVQSCQLRHHIFVILTNSNNSMLYVQLLQQPLLSLFEPKHASLPAWAYSRKPSSQPAKCRPSRRESEEQFHRNLDASRTAPAHLTYKPPSIIVILDWDRWVAQHSTDTPVRQRLLKHPVRIPRLDSNTLRWPVIPANLRSTTTLRPHVKFILIFAHCHYSRPTITCWRWWGRRFVCTTSVATNHPDRVWCVIERAIIV